MCKSSKVKESQIQIKAFSSFFPAKLEGFEKVVEQKVFQPNRFNTTKIFAAP